MASALKKDGGTGTPKSYDPIPPSSESAFILNTWLFFCCCLLAV